MYTTRFQLQLLHKAGFRLVRTNGGHARFRSENGTVIDVPIHQRQLSRTVVASIKHALREAL